MIRLLFARHLIGLPFALLLLASSLSAHAWGFTGHRYVNSLAIDSLPANLKPLYMANRAWIVQHSVDPDKWREGNRAEGPNHYINLDKFGVEAAETYPEDYWLAVGLYGKEAVDKNGLVPWRIGQYYGKLVRAFKERDAKQIVEISAWLGHYAGDVHVPFHVVANHDGQLTGQKGLHARFESNLVERQIKLEDLKPQTPREIKLPVAEAFAWAKTGLRRSVTVLEADRAAVSKDSAYGDDYYEVFGEKVRDLAVQCLEESGRNLASLWHSAWIAAGRPALPDTADVHAGEPLDKPTRDPDIQEQAAGSKP